MKANIDKFTEKLKTKRNDVIRQKRSQGFLRESLKAAALQWFGPDTDAIHMLASYSLDW